jgi:hypothetical protein
LERASPGKTLWDERYANRCRRPEQQLKVKPGQTVAWRRRNAATHRDLARAPCEFLVLGLSIEPNSGASQCSNRASRLQGTLGRQGVYESAFNMLVCGQCGASNEDSSSSCQNCRASLVGAAIGSETVVVPEPIQLAPVSSESELQSNSPFEVLERFVSALLRGHQGNSTATKIPVNLAQELGDLKRGGVLPHDQNLLTAIEKLLGVSLEPGGPAAPVISALLDAVTSGGGSPSTLESERDTPAGPHIPFPSAIVSILKPIPQRLKWIGAIVVPMLVGGGAAVPLTHLLSTGSTITTELRSQLAQTKTELSRTQSALQVEKDHAAHAEEDARDANQKLASLPTPKPAASLNDKELKNLQSRNQQLTNEVQTLSAFATSGYLEWQGGRKGTVHISAADLRSGVLRGTVPAGACVVVAVFGENIKAKAVGGASCNDFSFEVGKNSPTTAFVLWRRP